MRTSKCNSYVCLAAIVIAAAAGPALLCCQTAPTASAGGRSSPAQWSVQVERVQPGEIDLAYSFQAAIYENLLEELNKTHQFKNVYREGDRKAGDVANLLVLKTTVVKYKPGSETRRAVTTFSGATKVSVQAQLVTRKGKVLLERKVDGNVRFFGANLRATHNLARNIAKMIKQSPPGTDLDSATVTRERAENSLQGGL